MTAEAIAKVVRDIRTKRVASSDHAISTEGDRKALDSLATISTLGPVVDCSAVFRSIVDSNKSIDLYGDHVVAPPWDAATFAYENAFGNVHVIVMHVWEESEDHPIPDSVRWKNEEESFSWDEVRWILTGTLFMGGKAGGGVEGMNGVSIPIATRGPMHMWRLAVRADGTMADLRWFQMLDNIDPESTFDNPMITWLKAMTLANCSNIIVAEPERPRSERRRIERTGVRVSEIHIRPFGRAYRGNKAIRLEAGDTPLSSVRGHFANYGPKYGRGLLFGKYEGRFWIPQHVRGTAEAGEVEHSYVVEGSP